MKFAVLVFALLLAAQSAAAFASNASAAIGWLKQNQNADGSFPGWGGAAPALLALHANDSASPNTTSALRWLSNNLGNTSAANYDVWGEADAAGLALYALFNTNHSLIDSSLTNITATLLSFQAPSGGFKGWWSGEGTIEDSADTSWALLGLLSAGAINDANKTAAVNYLQSLQNPDGSFNLTSNISSAIASGLYPGAFAPDAISQTSLALLALNATGANATNASAAGALAYLKNASCSSNTGVFGMSMAAQAFNAMNVSGYAAAAVRRIGMLQRPSGGFSDAIRMSGDNPIDTGFAAFIMQNVSDATDMSGVCASYVPSPSLEFNGSVLSGTQQRIMLTSPGFGFAIAANVAVANVSISVAYEGTESAWLAPSFNPQTEAYEVLYGNTARTGTYLVNATLSFGSNTAIANRTFTVVPAPSPYVSNTVSSPQSPSQSISVVISFPQNSGYSRLTNDVPANSCSTAYECLSKVVSLTCRNYANLGCMITAVNGVAADYYKDNSWWAFCYNGAFSGSGVSNQRVGAGDAILLEYVIGSESGVSCNGGSAPVSSAYATAMPLPNPTATPAPSPTPMPSPSPTPAPAALPAQTPKVLDANTYAVMSTAAGSASLLLVYAAGAEGFIGNMTYHFNADYATYANGSIAFSPKPVLVKPGSVIAVWSVELPPNSQFNITLRARPEYAASIFANLGAPLLQAERMPAPTPAMPQNASAMETPRSTSASGFAIAGSSAIAVAVAVLIPIIGFALLIIKRNARR